ncbi:hypothetical protein TWF481_003013 [Arthrobotrys musiformis]|uniref:Fe2OG dioxygenase domain-containing protein n=1 Tax=Arthrobotrys musiformis TaxID=47236 RepID=A0AAV9VS35_9PEZI
MAAAVALQRTISAAVSAKALTTSERLGSAVVLIRPVIQPPFCAIRRLFDHLHANPNDAASLNAAYPKRGIFKTAAMVNKFSDQKFTIDLSPTRDSLIPQALRVSLNSHGFDDMLSFFRIAADTHVPTILSSLSQIAGTDLTLSHRQQSLNLNFRLCDYNPGTADPVSSNGCGEHTDYGTFSIIFQDGTPGLEIEAPYAPGTWIPIPGDATVVLAGWCALIMSGRRICAARHRVRRVPGVRRLSAVLFVAPDLDAKLKPTAGAPVNFSQKIMDGDISVEWFKEVMGKKWRYREGNLEFVGGEDDGVAQDDEIKRLIFG